MRDDDEAGLILEGFGRCGEGGWRNIHEMQGHARAEIRTPHQRCQFPTAPWSELHNRRKWPHAREDIACMNAQQMVLCTRNTVPRKPRDRFEEDRSKLVVEIPGRQLARRERKIIRDILGEPAMVGQGRF